MDPRPLPIPPRGSSPGPATAALLDATAHHEAGSWLVPGGSAGLAEGIALDHPEATVTWQPADLRERRALDTGPSNLRILEPGTSVGDIGAVAIAAPPDRDLARRMILNGRDALVPGGRLFIAGANSEGIRSVIADAAKVLGPPLREDYRARGRLALFTQDVAIGDEPAWAVEPGVAPGTWRAFTLEIGNISLPMVTQAGVFAGAGVDAGTRLLLGALPDQVIGQVLDVGCGAGVIGIAAAQLGAEAVDLTDVNLIAVRAARENIERLGLARCRALAGDVYDAIGDERYALIVSNPPFHRGKAVDFTVADRLIDGAPAHLGPAGSLLVVANAFLAYGKRIARVFGRVETIAATRQYHVLRGSGPR